AHEEGRRQPDTAEVFKRGHRVNGLHENSLERREHLLVLVRPLEINRSFEFIGKLLIRLLNHL
ncbi:MAG: hypothetical protein ACQEVT_16490, partial [Pseudomonadota bacterium]